MISEVLRPDPDILALTARPQLLARAFGSKWDERGRTHTVASTVDRREARGTHDRRESYIRDSQSKPKQLVKKKKRNPTHPPPPLGKTRSAIGPRGCHSRALTLEKAHGCRRSPHTPAGCGTVVSGGRRLPPPQAQEHTQGSAKTVSSKSRPPSPTTGSSPQAGGRLPARRSHCRFNSGSGELLSRPLNSRDRARARRLACDWLLGRGRRRPRRGARVDLPLPFPQFVQKGAVRRLGTGRRRGRRQVLSSDWLSGYYVRRRPQLPACAVGKNEPRAGEGSHAWSTARAQSAIAICLMRRFWFPQVFGGGGQTWGQVSVCGEARHPLGCPRLSRSL